MEKKIRERLEEVRKYLQADGGDLEVVEIKDKDVKLRLVGACGCCPHAMITLKEGVEKDLKEQIDTEITVYRVD